MPAKKRFPTKYPGVYFIESKAVSDGRQELVYYIRYRRDGKLIEEKAGRQFQDDMTAARANTLRSKRIEGDLPSNESKRETERLEKEAAENQWTINKLWEKYCETYSHNKGLKHEKRKFDLYLKNGLGKKDPKEILPLDVDRLRLGLERKKKRTQAARILELLRRTINFGVKRGLIPPLPFKIEIPKLNNQTTEDLTPDQLKKLIQALDADEDQTVANIMRLALFTGMRRSEILKLQWSDIDSDRGFITLQDPKGGPDQKIPLSSAASDVFNGIVHVDESPYVFPGRFGESHLTVVPRKSLDRIRKAAGLPEGFRPLHGLRHVYASMLASSGKVDLYVLQRLLTHKSPAMTQRYAHLRDEALKQASDLAGNIVTEMTTEKNEKTG